MKKLILLFILAFGLVVSQGFEAVDTVLYVQDGGGTVELTPLQGAHIVGDGSAYANLASTVVLDYTDTFIFEWKAYFTSQADF